MSHSTATSFTGTISQSDMNVQADLAEAADVAMAQVWSKINGLSIDASAKASLVASLGSVCDALTSLRTNANSLLGQTCFSTVLPSGGTGKRTS